MLITIGVHDQGTTAFLTEGMKKLTAQLGENLIVISHLNKIYFRCQNLTKEPRFEFQDWRSSPTSCLNVACSLSRGTARIHNEFEHRSQK